ncbi:MAG TPA: molybdopterin cofactor-binding domain-containing protein [Acidimicrobiales bacterium]
MTDTDAAAGTTRYAGARIARVEDPRLLTGRGTFVDDVTRPGMLHACFVRSPFARARVTGIDVTEALALPGVRAVFVAADLNPDVRGLWYSITGPDVPASPLPPLADGEVRFVGDPVALVIAANRYVAEDATELVAIDYDPLPAVPDYSGAHESEALVWDGCAGNVCGTMSGGRADAVDDALAGAAHAVEATLHEQAYAAVPMETRGMVVEWDAAGPALTIWAATQSPHEVRSVCARVGGDLPRRQPRRVWVGRTGGGGVPGAVRGRQLHLHRARRPAARGQHRP